MQTSAKTKAVHAMKKFTTSRLRVLLVGTVIVFAFGAGSAYAGSKWLITSTNQIKPSVLAKLKGKVGKTGPQGARGATGATGAAGPAGAQGSIGPAGPTGSQGSKGSAGAGLSSLLAPKAFTTSVTAQPGVVTSTTGGRYFGTPGTASGQISSLTFDQPTGVTGLITGSATVTVPSTCTDSVGDGEPDFDVQVELENSSNQVLTDPYGNTLGGGSFFGWTAGTAGTQVTVPLASSLVQAPLSSMQNITGEVLLTDYCTGTDETLTVDSVSLSILGLTNPGS
jgi:hypothetical protein